MFRSASPPSHHLGARPRLRASQLAMLFSCALMPLVASVALWFAVTSLTLPQSGHYPGRLRPTGDPLTVNLPPHMAVETVLVGEGDTVQKDAPLVRLNADLARSTLLSLEDAMRQLHYDRECALTWPVDPFAQRRTLGPPESDGILDDVLAQAIAKCDLQRAEITVELMQATTQEATLAQRLFLIDQKVHLLRRDAARNQLRGTAYEALSVALAHNLLRAELEGARLELQNTRLRIKRRLLENANATSQAQRDLRAQITQLRKHLDDPIIRAPFAGVVRRVRVLDHQDGTVLPSPAIELREQQGEYEVRATLPTTVANHLSPDTEVHITLPRATTMALHLTGRTQASHFPHPSAPELRQVDIVLDRMSALALASENSGLALHGRATAAEIRVALAPAPIRARLLASLNALAGGSFTKDDEDITRLEQAKTLPAAAVQPTRAQEKIEQIAALPPDLWGADARNGAAPK